ncbi:MAG: adenylosuccinate lyase [Deltaproteobacteria bacterium]|nr:adenylosuccinate lyase [Deltaproteobacteria bacterium]
MIPRYSRQTMAQLWEPEYKFQKWLEIEIAACEAWSELGKIPKSDLDQIKQKAKFSIARIDELEKEVKHDVIAFVSCVAENVGDAGRFIHMGLTSSDVLDTALALQLKEAGLLIQKGLEGLAEVLKKRAHEFKDTLQMGRSHGIHAEPITFGLKLAIWYDEIRRHQERLNLALEQIAYGKISGAVGTFANIPPAIETYVMKKLGLKAAPVSNQIVQRDRHAFYFSVLAGMAGSIEKFATEIRHLQRTEVLEACEYFSPGQKGSSAMPHKKNPILSENLCGLARLVRGYAVAALEDIALWHERDISHSSVERVAAPDATILVDFMLVRMTEILAKLIVYPENMKKNLEKLGGVVFSQRVLLALIEAGLSREEAYRVVQDNAMKVWDEGGHLQDYLNKDSRVKGKLNSKQLAELFDYSYHTQQVATIFKRVFKE